MKGMWFCEQFYVEEFCHIESFQQMKAEVFHVISLTNGRQGCRNGRVSWGPNLAHSNEDNFFWVKNY